MGSIQSQNCQRRHSDKRASFETSVFPLASFGSSRILFPLGETFFNLLGFYKSFTLPAKHSILYHCLKTRSSSPSDLECDIQMFVDYVTILSCWLRN